MKLSGSKRIEVKKDVGMVLFLFRLSPASLIFPLLPLRCSGHKTIFEGSPLGRNRCLFPFRFFILLVLLVTVSFPEMHCLRVFTVLLSS